MATIKGLGGGGEIISQLFPVKTWKSSGKAQCWWCTTLWIHSVPLNWTPKIYWNGKLYVMYNSPQLKQQMHGVWENAGVKFRSLFFFKLPLGRCYEPLMTSEHKGIIFLSQSGLALSHFGRDQIIFLLWGWDCPGRYRMLSSIVNFYPLDGGRWQRQPPVVTTKIITRSCQMSLRVHNHPLENHCSILHRDLYTKQAFPREVSKAFLERINSPLYIVNCLVAKEAQKTWDHCFPRLEWARKSRNDLVGWKYSF